MIELIKNWWNSLYVITALNNNNFDLAERRLAKLKIQKSPILGIAKLLNKKKQAETELEDAKQEIKKLKQEVIEFRQKVNFLELEQLFDNPDARGLLTPDSNLIDFITNSFHVVEHDRARLQVTGIDRTVFDPFEHELSLFLTEAFKKNSTPKKREEIQKAIEDLEKLKKGIDPEYAFNFTPDVYLLKYFAENVYCNYLVWFLIYQAGLLPTNFNVLDLAAGPGTVAYGLALFLQSSHQFLQNPLFHISYYSLEAQANLQYRGLQFWRRYLESHPQPPNTYFRFDTANIFDYENFLEKLPRDFFDFVFISHCFFSDRQFRERSYKAYSKIIENCLKSNGKVVLVIQKSKLFKSQNFIVNQNKDIKKEQTLIVEFLENLGLRLEWYKYLTSTGSRTKIKNFYNFASNHLPLQTYLNPLKTKYLNLAYNSHYTLDNYVIFAKRI
jgi:hypothetical protein